MSLQVYARPDQLQQQRPEHFFCFLPGQREPSHARHRGRIALLASDQPAAGVEAKEELVGRFGCGHGITRSPTDLLDPRRRLEGPGQEAGYQEARNRFVKHVQL